MPIHVLGGQVPTLSTDEKTQNPNITEKKHVYLIHGYDKKESFYGLSNYCKPNEGTPGTPSTKTTYSFNEGTSVISGITNAEVFLQAQKIQDAKVRSDFIAEASKPHKNNKGEDISAATWARTVAFRSSSYKKYALADTGNTDNYSFDQWGVRAEQVQNYINYIKYQENPSFKAAIDAYIDAKKSWEAAGKADPRPWIGEDTGAADYRDDNWGMGYEMLGANKLGNSQVAFAEALMDASTSATLKNPGLTLQDFSNGGSQTASMKTKNDTATQTYRLHVEPALMAQVGWNPIQIAKITSGENDVIDVANTSTSAPMAVKSSFSSTTQKFLSSDANNKRLDTKKDVRHMSGSDVLIKGNHGIAARYPGSAAAGYAEAVTKAKAAAAASTPASTHAPTHTPTAPVAAPAPTHVAPVPAPAAAPVVASVTTPVASGTANAMITAFVAAAESTAKTVKTKWSLNAITPKTNGNQSTYEITFADKTKATAVLSAESAKITTDNDAVKYSCTVTQGQLPLQQQYELIAHQSFAARKEQNKTARPTWADTASVTISAITGGDASSATKNYRDSAGKDVLLTETECTMLKAYHAAGYQSAEYKGSKFDLKTFNSVVTPDASVTENTSLSP